MIVDDFFSLILVQKYIKLVEYKSKLTIKYLKKLHLGMIYY